MKHWTKRSTNLHWLGFYCFNLQYKWKVICARLRSLDVFATKIKMITQVQSMKRMNVQCTFCKLWLKQNKTLEMPFTLQCDDFFLTNLSYVVQCNCLWACLNHILCLAGSATQTQENVVTKLKTSYPTKTRGWI